MVATQVLETWVPYANRANVDFKIHVEIEFVKLKFLLWKSQEQNPLSASFFLLLQPKNHNLRIGIEATLRIKNK